MCSKEDIVNSFFSNHDSENGNNIEPETIHKDEFKNEKIKLINEKNLLKWEIICPKYNKKMIMLNLKEGVDKKERR